MSRSPASQTAKAASQPTLVSRLVGSTAGLIGLGVLAAGLIWGLARLAVRPPAQRPAADAVGRSSGTAGFEPTVEADRPAPGPSGGPPGPWGLWSKSGVLQSVCIQNVDKSGNAHQGRAVLARRRVGMARAASVV